MKDAPLPYAPRIPVADSYVAAIGRAAYNFAYLEWSIVWLGETLQPGFINTVGSLTAGQIARQFESFAASVHGADSDNLRLKTLAASFLDLVHDRNNLLHGNPFTGDSGEQRLLYNGKSGRRDWSAEDIIEAARAFENASIEANELLHGGRLEQYRRSTGQA